MSHTRKKQVRTGGSSKRPPSVRDRHAVGSDSTHRPSQLLQHRIKELARSIKDKHTPKQSAEDNEQPAGELKLRVGESEGVEQLRNNTRVHNVNTNTAKRTSRVHVSGTSLSFTQYKNPRVVWESEGADSHGQMKLNSETIYEYDANQQEEQQQRKQKQQQQQPAESKILNDSGDERTELEEASHVTLLPQPAASSAHPKRLIRRSVVSPSIGAQLHSRGRSGHPTIRVPSQESSSDVTNRHSNQVTNDLLESPKITIETEPVQIEYPSDLPARYRNTNPQHNDTNSVQADDPLRLKPRLSLVPDDKLFTGGSRLSLVPGDKLFTGGSGLLHAPRLAPGAGRARSNSVISIGLSSAYRTRRSSVFRLGMMTSPDGAFDSPRTLTPSDLSAQTPHRPSVVELFKRSKQSRHRRLSVYLQTADETKEKAIDRLRRMCRIVQIVTGICLALKRYVKVSETKQWSLIEMHLNLRADMEKTLAFDPVMFSKLRVTRGSEKLCGLLSEKPATRTKSDVDLILVLLRNNKTFADYNRETQIALAKVIEYLRYEPRRIVLKEGHKASGFYIILSGTCLINQKEIDPRNNEVFVRTIDEIHSGDSFGELALLNNTTRAVSVICKDECEILLVDKQDFDEVIRKPLEKERRSLITFCKTQHVFEKLPTNFDFHGNHYAISAKKYKPGEVITCDIDESDFVYVVKSGKCRVISELTEVKGPSSPMSKVLQETLNGEEWKKVATIRRRQVAVVKAMANKRKWKQTEPTGSFSYRGRQKTFFSLTGIAKSVDSDVINDVTVTTPPSLSEDEDQPQTKPTEDANNVDKAGTQLTRRRISMTATALSEKEKRSNMLICMNPCRLKSTFAEVAVLHEGDSFGIETLVSTGQSQTRLSLVSDGVECIVISKKFFAAQATIKTIQISTKKAIEYPSAKYTLDKICQARAWTSYKETLVKTLYNHRKVES